MGNTKNYLFPPFKDDDDKIGAFDYLVNNLDNEGLVIFLGRLESTYDAIISKLSSENAVAIKDEEVIISLEDRIRDLKADNERLKKGFGHGVLVELEQVDSLKEEVEEVKADNVKAREYIVHVEKENDSLKDEVESLQDQLKSAVNDYESLLNNNSVK